jgi:hypothetical protein
MEYSVPLEGGCVTENGSTKIARKSHAYKRTRTIAISVDEHVSIAASRGGASGERNFFLICCLILHSAPLAQRVRHGSSDPSNL